MFTFRYLVITCLSALLLLSGCADLDLSEITPRAPETLTVRVTGAVVNLRSGPGLDFAILGTVQEGDRLPVTGRTASGAWLQVQAAQAPRWIYGGLTNISSAELAELPVALPPLGESLSASAGQSESAAAELEPAAMPEPVPTAPPLTADYIYVGPGSYDRSRFPALSYEWELVFTDNSEQWDWVVTDFPGCYDAVRLFIGETARAKGLTRAEIILSDPFVERDLTSYAAVDFTHKFGVYVPSAGDADAYLAPRWPDWRVENLPNPDMALVHQICTDWPTKTGVQNGEYTCTLHPMWGNTETEWGRVYLDASANIVMSLVLGSILHGNDHESGRNFMLGSWSNSIYLWPQKNGQPVGHGTCIHLTRT